MKVTIQWFDMNGEVVAEEDKRVKSWDEAETYADAMMERVWC